MAYDRLDLTTGDLLDSDVFKHLEDGIEGAYNKSHRMFEELYDTKKNEDFELVHKTCENLLEPKYSNSYASSTFSGWWGCIGNPQDFQKIEFVIQPRTDKPITTITVKILELPNLEEVTFGTATYAVTPRPTSWKILQEKVITIDGEEVTLTENSWNILSCQFDEPIINEDGKYLFLAVLCNNLVTMGFFKTIYNDIPYNPWIYYSTSGSLTSCTGLGVGTYDKDSKEVYTLACKLYRKSKTTTYTELGTSKKDKFFKLVNDCINNSDSFGEIFTEAYKYKYINGSIDLTKSLAKSFQNSSSTFTGVIFPIGILSSEIEVQGVLLQIKCRSNNGSTKPITKVDAFLYSVENVPTKSEYGGKAFSTTSPTLLKTGSVTCNIAVGEQDTVFIEWSDGVPFVNTDNAFLMLGYECNSFNYRCCTGNSGASVCKAIDGKTYGTLYSWYSTSQVGGKEWRPGWDDTSANAWSFVTSTKYYDLGDKFYTLLEDAIQNKFGDVDFDINIPPTSEVRLAKQYDVVVGDKFQLYYEGVIKGFDVLNEGILVSCSVGKQYPRYWEFEPTADNAGKTYNLSIRTRQFDGSVISSGTTKIVVHQKLTNEKTPTKLTALIFGDSLTSSASWAAEGFRRIYGTDREVLPTTLGVTNKIVTYGSKNNTHNGFKIFHEGYGGWTWNSFLTAERGSDSTTNGIIVTLDTEHGYDLDTVQKSIWVDNNNKLWELEDFPSKTQIKFNRGSGNNATQEDTPNPTSLTCEALNLNISPSNIVWETTNPFYDESTESLNFNAHAQRYNSENADLVSCLLTWNGGGGTANFDQTSKINVHIDRATKLLKAIHEDFPNAKIICMGIQISSITGGAGYNYGANGGYADTWSTAFYAFDYNKALEELITGDPELNEYCYYVDTKGQFDTRYCMPYSNVAVNTRVTNVTEMRGTNGVHPSTAGYYQIGDAFYRVLHRVIPVIKQIKETN